MEVSFLKNTKFTCKLKSSRGCKLAPTRFEEDEKQE